MRRLAGEGYRVRRAVGRLPHATGDEEREHQRMIDLALGLGLGLGLGLVVAPAHDRPCE